MALDGKEALKETEAWSNLQTYFNENKNTIDMKKMFDEDSRRFDKFSLKLETPKDGPFLVDYSKNKINEDVFEMLMDLAKERGVEVARDAMFAGYNIFDTSGFKITFSAPYQVRQCNYELSVIQVRKSTSLRTALCSMLP